MLHPPHLYLTKFKIFKWALNAILHFMLYLRMTLPRSHCKTHTIASIHGTETVFDPHYSLTETSQALL